VADLAATGTTVLLTTHYMAEADELCDRIAVIAAGRIQALGTPAELKHHADGRRVLEVEAYGVPDTLVAELHTIAGVREAGVEARGALQVLTVQSDARADVQADVLQALAGVRLGRVTARQPTLEDAYVAIVNATAAPDARPEAVPA
jgi:ABC-2 type transport system ATP-binding protein